MEISESFVVPAPREQVWAALNDPAILEECIPGCQELEAESEDRLNATVTLKIGPVKATFRGTVDLFDKVPPESFVIQGEGKGGVAGFAKGSAKVFLDEHPEGTLLRYEVNVAIGGKLAQLGSRLIMSTSRKLSAQFFDQFAARFEPDEAKAG
jgi:carbon monoxide dehydrogenase subunit G